MSGDQWLEQVVKTQGSDKATGGAKSIAMVIAAFYNELVDQGVPDEQAGVITAEWAKLTVSRLMTHDQKQKGKRR